MDTLYSRVSPCDFLDTKIGEPCSNLKNPNVVGAYFGADAGVFFYGQETPYNIESGMRQRKRKKQVEKLL